MKYLAKTLFVVGLGAVLTVAAFAQGAGPVGGGPTPGHQGGANGGRMQHMQQMQSKVLAQLNLTADQQKQVQALDSQTKAAFVKLKNSSSAGQKPDPEAMKGIMKSHRDGLMKILTPAQQAQFKKIMAEMRKNAQESGKGNPPGH